MTDYISRAEALAVFGDIHPLDHNANAYAKQIKHIPAEDVRPVVRGKWVYDDEDIYPHCSECLTQENGRRNFCPNCGADMRGKVNG